MVRFDATTLWHLDAAEWAPSTASKADNPQRANFVRFTPESGHRELASARLLGAPLRINALVLQGACHPTERMGVCVRHVVAMTFIDTNADAVDAGAGG